MTVPMHRVLERTDAEEIFALFWDAESLAKYAFHAHDRDWDGYAYEDGLRALIAGHWRPGITKLRWTASVIRALKSGQVVIWRSNGGAS
jgi:hypothetical protein